MVHPQARGLPGDEAWPQVRIGRERLRQILHAEAITFQRTKTWKESPDPLKEQKLARIEGLLDHQRDRTFAFDEFGPLTIKPGRRVHLGSSRVSAPAAGQLHSPTAPDSSTPATRSGSDRLWGTIEPAKGS